mmetsp:Transcript_30344/g.70336  ORF Transcript_30344/g.70336 Transcript_30344/m.70336 type:complete len:395 (+) Transcript_30344:966-2150(+)
MGGEDKDTRVVNVEVNKDERRVALDGVRLEAVRLEVVDGRDVGASVVDDLDGGAREAVLLSGALVGEVELTARRVNRKTHDRLVGDNGGRLSVGHVLLHDKALLRVRPEQELVRRVDLKVTGEVGLSVKLGGVLDHIVSVEVLVLNRVIHVKLRGNRRRASGRNRRSSGRHDRRGSGGGTSREVRRVRRRPGGRVESRGTGRLVRRRQSRRHSRLGGRGSSRLVGWGVSRGRLRGRRGRLGRLRGRARRRRRGRDLRRGRGRAIGRLVGRFESRDRGRHLRREERRGVRVRSGAHEFAALASEVLQADLADLASEGLGHVENARELARPDAVNLLKALVADHVVHVHRLKLGDLLEALEGDGLFNGESIRREGQRQHGGEAEASHATYTQVTRH